MLFILIRVYRRRGSKRETRAAQVPGDTITRPNKWLMSASIIVSRVGTSDKQEQTKNKKMT